MLLLDLGKPYKFTLETGATKEIIVRGTSPHSDRGSVLHLTVDGEEGDYDSVNAALCGNYVTVSVITR